MQHNSLGFVIRMSLAITLEMMGSNCVTTISIKQIVHSASSLEGKMLSKLLKLHESYPTFLELFFKT